ncbi:MAG TPA: S8 family serine peptidase [Candidatus Sulfopaludibacter sp.]|jgi:subtilisin family serine protease|nr:S8 family serine peptidase [Candidatus Sulfopaludibacter sp.]
MLKSSAASNQRILVRAQQAAARTRIQAAGGKVLGAVDTVKNALIVQIADGQAGALESLPGVLKVYPVRTFQLLLDHALPLHKVPQAWSQVGISNAGAGIKIGLIDTGIDIRHPSFNAGGFTAPAGFPLADTQVDLGYTNGKVIVARSYVNQLPSSDPDVSMADHVGHGTATASVAAGVSNAGPLATISGVAPQAWIGAYKVFGTPGYNDFTTSDAVILALEDAVNDGMDVISMSIGSTLAPRLESDMEAQVMDLVSAMGVIVVVAAGNNGSDPFTISSPADAPSVIAVGAVNNDRLFADSLVLPDGSSLIAVPGSAPYEASPVTGPLIDVTSLGDNGQVCAGLPPGSLAGAIALIYRGNCTFETKINFAQSAGANAVVVYDNNPSEDPLTMSVGSATLPAVFISNADGLALQPQLAAGLAVTIQLVRSAHYVNPARIAIFSSRGPNVDYSIKPDLMAVGQNIYTATQSLDSAGDMFDATGYTLTQGTSFSTPLVAGAAALLKQARPGLTVDQYRSLLINSTSAASLVPGTPASVQQGGAGVLDVLAALNANIAAAPVSLGLGAGGSTVDTTQALQLTNLGTVADTFQISVTPAVSGAPVPEISAATVKLDPGASVSLPVRFHADALAAGAYEGFVNIAGVASGTMSHVPYWYGVSSGAAGHITILYTSGAASAGSRISEAVVFRVTDPNGLAVTTPPTVTALTSGAQVASLSSLNYAIPNAFTFTARLSSNPGGNVYQIQAGGITTTVTIVGQ